MQINKFTDKRMTTWREMKWWLAQKMIGWILDLTENEMRAETVGRFLAFQGSFWPDEEFETKPMTQRGLVELYNRLVAAEVLTQDPARANAAVIQLDGRVRLVVDQLFARDGDIAHARGTPEFDQALRYWRLDRSEATAEQHVPAAPMRTFFCLSSARGIRGEGRCTVQCSVCQKEEGAAGPYVLDPLAASLRRDEQPSDPLAELAKIIGQRDPFQKDDASREFRGRP